MSKKKFHSWLLLAAILILIQVSGCVSGSLNTPTVDLEETQTLFDAAKFTGAATKSPYEFYSAEIFLRKAKDEIKLGNDNLGNIYLNVAYEKALKAYENAKRYKRTK